MPPAEALPPAETVPDWCLHPGVEVFASPIAGRGLRTREPLAAGVVVLRAPGPDGPLTPDELGRLNHSCDPSLWWTGDTLTTRHELAAGAELTLDYATCCTGLVLYCHCETYRCRQVIEGTDWQIPQLQQRYSGHWTPYVQSLIDGRP